MHARPVLGFLLLVGRQVAAGPLVVGRSRRRCGPHLGDRPPPLLVVSGRRRPDEVMLLAVSVILSVSYPASASRPGSVNDLLPEPVLPGRQQW